MIVDDGSLACIFYLFDHLLACLLVFWLETGPQVTQAGLEFTGGGDWNSQAGGD